MDFAARQDHHGKVFSIALVALLHVLIGGIVIQGIATRSIVLPDVPDEISVALKAQQHPPPPAPEPPPPPMALPPPRLTVPIPDIEVARQPAEPTVTAVAQAEPAAPVPARVAGPPALAPPAAAPPATTRSAVLVDANACARPEYPPRALRNRETGVVVLSLLVDVDGRVANSRVTRSSGSRDLDRAAQAALGLCRFQPAMENGKPQQAWAPISYEWTLD